MWFSCLPFFNSTSWVWTFLLLHCTEKNNYSLLRWFKQVCIVEPLILYSWSSVVLLSHKGKPELYNFDNSLQRPKNIGISRLLEKYLISQTIIWVNESHFKLLKHYEEMPIKTTRVHKNKNWASSWLLNRGWFLFHWMVGFGQKSYVILKIAHNIHLFIYLL